MKNKKSSTGCLIFLIIGIAFIAYLFTDFNDTSIGNKYEIIDVGYYKHKSKLRYFTAYIKNGDTINENNPPKELLVEIEKHGRRQPNTEGQITATFYYLTKENTPDITMSSTAGLANDIAHNHKPLVAVWNLGNGTINVIYNPE